jgi:DNA invertase Pin-like site-specific DNA recombinase
MISARTKAALAAAKAKGTRLGNPQIAAAQAKGTARTKAAAAQFAANMLPFILPLKVQGASLRKIAEALNERGIETALGGKWAATRVADILCRVG